jgi:hypothetical protein
LHHSELLGMKDQRLRVLAPDATHQHFKGGLYRFLGKAKDADTGEYLIGKDGEPRVAYLHCYPYDREVWVRDSSEFYGMVGHNGDSLGQPRFRQIEGTIQT